jgi:hypothetical protein
MEKNSITVKRRQELWRRPGRRRRYVDRLAAYCPG